MRHAWLVCCAIGLSPVAWGDPLSFTEAVARAGADGPSIAARRAAADSARQAIGPAGQLPDPKLALGVDGYPVSGPARFTLDRDDFTALRVGIMQDVPSSAERRARTDLAKAEAGAAEAALAISRLEARLAAADAWISLYYGLARRDVLNALTSDLELLSQATTAGLASATATADAALTVQIEVARMADRLTEADAFVAGARAELERWIGPLGADLPGPDGPEFNIDPVKLRSHLEQHVELSGSAALLGEARAGLGLARAETKADWSWELAYQRRNPAFGDMVSVGVTFSLPLFQSTRQRPAIDARRSDVGRAMAEREATLREHRARLESGLAEHDAIAQRLARSTDMVAPLARQREAVAEQALASGTAKPSDLIAARMKVREVELERLDLAQRLAQVSARLTLEYGEAVQ